MLTSVIYENQKTFTIFNIDSDGDIDPIERLILNGSPLINGVHYTAFWPIDYLCIISGLTHFLKTSDDLDIEIYKSDNVTLADSLMNVEINFNYNYIEISGDVDNDVNPSDTTDKSDEMNTPLTIRGCQDVDLNGHLLHIANIGVFTNNISQPILINGNPATGSDFNKSTHPSLLPLTFDGSGVLTTDGGLEDPFLIEIASTPRTIPFSIETEKGSNDEIGVDAFLIDSVGFRNINHPVPKWIDINGVEHVISPTPSIGDSFKVEVTSLGLFISINGSNIASYSRNVQYTSDKGTIVPSGTQTYLTPAVFTPTSYGIGEIVANFGAVSARQIINVVIPRQPNFGGTSFNNICPVSNFNLNTLVDSNLQSGVGLTTRFFTDAGHVNEVVSTNINTVGTHTFYAFQHDNSTNCWSTARQITVTITACSLPDPSVSTDWNGVTACNSHVVNPVITENYPNPTYQWWKDGVQVASTLNYTITSSGNYTFHIYNTGTDDHYQKSGSVVINHTLSFNTNLPSNGTAGNSYSVVVNYPAEVSSIVWEKYNGSTWDVISGVNTYSYTPSTNGQYRVKVTNPCGTITSDVIEIDYSDPIITTDWEGEYCNSHSVTPVITNNYPNPSYEWKRNGVVVANTLTYNITSTANYTFTVSDGGDSVSKSQVVLIAHSLVYTTNLPSTSNVGSLLTIVVNYPDEVTGPIWEKFNPDTMSWDTVATNVYTYTPSTQGEYRTKVTNFCGIVNSNNVIVSFSIPVIENDWDGEDNCGNITLTPDITDNYPSPVYEWRKNGVVVASTLSYNVTSSGNYTFTVSQDGNSVSKSGFVTIEETIVFDQNLPGSIAEPQTLTVQIDNPESITNIIWQWKRYSGDPNWEDLEQEGLSHEPTRNGLFRVIIEGSCNTLTSNTTSISVFAVNDYYEGIAGNIIVGDVSSNDYGCEDETNPNLRTFYVIRENSLSPSDKGTMIGSSVNGEFTYLPYYNFSGVVTFEYDIYCTLEPEGWDVDLAFAKSTATVTLVSICPPLEDFQIEYDPIAYVGGKTCYESYKIVNLIPDNVDIENIDIETEGVEIVQPYNYETQRFIGKITQKHTVKVKVTITTCGGSITREIYQKVSLKPCCD